jgi:hypothetical protein
LFNKRISSLSIGDIERVWNDRWQESVNLELKETIPAQDGDDRWITKGDRVGDYGRQKILREIVAFANAQGGTLFLGVRESEDKPARAEGPSPIPRCIDLAERLRRMMMDDIEPRPIAVECEGFPLQGDEGVVVIRIAASPIGPHWVRSSRDPSFRRGDESVTMSMTELQSLTLRLVRTENERAQILGELDNSFLTSFDGLLAGYYRALDEAFKERAITKGCVGLRCTAIPLAPLNLDYVATQKEFRTTEMPSLLYKLENQDWHQVARPSHWRSDQWETAFRQTVSQSDWNTGYFKRSVDWRGIANCEWIVGIPSGRAYLSWILYSAYLVLKHADQVRRVASVPDLPYALDLALRCAGGVTGGWGDYDVVGRQFPSILKFSPMEIRDEASHVGILNRIQYEFWTAAGDDQPAIAAIRQA